MENAYRQAEKIVIEIRKWKSVNYFLISSFHYQFLTST
jgi:hypothetical protein